LLKTFAVSAPGYEDWGIILFPSGQDEDAPFKEFKVACHVVPDPKLPSFNIQGGIIAVLAWISDLEAFSHYPADGRKMRRSMSTPPYTSNTTTDDPLPGVAIVWFVVPAVVVVGLLIACCWAGPLPNP